MALQQRSLLAAACIGSMCFTVVMGLLIALWDGPHHRDVVGMAAQAILAFVFEVPVFFARKANNNAWMVMMVILWPPIPGFFLSFGICLLVRVFKRELHYHLASLYLGLISSFLLAVLCAELRYCLSLNNHHFLPGMHWAVVFGAVVDLLLTPFAIYFFECLIYGSPELAGPIRFGVEPREPAEETDEKR